MEMTQERVLEWFARYFEAVARNQGDMKTAENLKVYFTPDLEFVMHTASPSSTTAPKDLESLIMSFVHPGLQEQLTPRYYVVDVGQMITVVQFEIRFSDKPTGRVWPPVQASAHYHLVADSELGLKIAKIEYWTGHLPAEVLEVWAERRQQALAASAR
jgi:hypothetical protein